MSMDDIVKLMEEHRWVTSKYICYKLGMAKSTVFNTLSRMERKDMIESERYMGNMRLYKLSQGI